MRVTLRLYGIRAERKNETARFVSIFFIQNTMSENVNVKGIGMRGMQHFQENVATSSWLL
jgi:hypothetical protein